MEDPNAQTGWLRRRQQRELIVQRGFEMQRVERSVLAAAYETLWPPAGRVPCDRLQVSRRAGTSTAGGGPMWTRAHALGRRGGTGSVVAMGG